MQLPAQVLQRLWKGTGFLVPDELDDLIIFLQEARASHKSSFADLQKEYEAYVQLCKSLRVVPDDPLASPTHRKPLGSLGPHHSSATREKTADLPLRFARIDALRADEQTLADLDLIRQVLFKIRDRFSNVRKHNGGEVRLFISSSGPDMALQLVYEPKPLTNSRNKIVAEAKIAAEAKPVPRDSEAVAVNDWMNLGLRAIQRMKKEDPQPVFSGLTWDFAPEVHSTWNTALDNMLDILQKAPEETGRKTHRERT